MPFPVDEKYIYETEQELNTKFPTKFKQRMMNNNGGEFKSGELEFELYPFFDKSDNKRISRTCNHIGLETKNAHEWKGFPETAVAIGSDGFGNQLILMKTNEKEQLGENIYFWNHETTEIELIADSIIEIEE
jgi:hypothetical protein